MNAKTTSVVAVHMALLMACGSRPTPAPAAEPAPVAPPPAAVVDNVDHLGDSPQTAVPVPVDAPEGGVPFENNWIFDRVGRFRRLGAGTGSLEGRRYDVIDVETPAGEKYKYFFDITENWNSWKPPQ